MTKHCRLSALCPVLLAAGLLAGCAGSDEVRELSERTAANTATLAASIERMAQQSDRLAQRRADAVARLIAATARIEARHELDLALLQETEDSRAIRTFRALSDWSGKVREIDSSAARDEAALAERVLNGRKAMDVRSEDLRRVAEILARLAERDTNRQRARFLADYGQAVYAEIDADAQAADAAVAFAEELLGLIRSDTTSSDADVPGG